jgi:hypothetical protein
MDTISVKLIERKGLLSQNSSFEYLFKTIQDKNDELIAKNLNISKTALKWQILYESETKKSLLLSENFNTQKQITVNNKRKARRNGLYLFGGGVSVGVVIFALLMN